MSCVVSDCWTCFILYSPQKTQVYRVRNWEKPLLYPKGVLNTSLLGSKLPSRSVATHSSSFSPRCLCEASVFPWYLAYACVILCLSGYVAIFFFFFLFITLPGQSLVRSGIMSFITGLFRTQPSV